MLLITTNTIRHTSQMPESEVYAAVLDNFYMAWPVSAEVTSILAASLGPNHS